MHVDFIRNAGQVVFPLRGVLDPADDGLLTFLEFEDSLAQLVELNDARFDFSGNQQAHDVVILSGKVDGFEGAEEVNFRHRGPAEEGR